MDPPHCYVKYIIADAGVDILLLDYQRKFIGQGGVTQFGKNADGSYHAIINTNWIRTVGTTACPEPFHKPQPLIITWNAQTNHEVQFVDWSAKPSTQPHLCG